MVKRPYAYAGPQSPSDLHGIQRFSTQVGDMHGTTLFCKQVSP
jgi:hypothetical protein